MKVSEASYNTAIKTNRRELIRTVEYIMLEFECRLEIINTSESGTSLDTVMSIVHISVDFISLFDKYSTCISFNNFNHFELDSHWSR